ncbi:uncharacterized protein B0I36DRAFT_26845 [Microdochium trichocladiopsis]|uniref:Uncharacterized protein n=1 Tax=Microdochium trichocladiopsis TaxID=1682393 RepID=A0A9P9BKT2_9PEZI|nr:uncharacterized protein B0I36DRAFT_26845 [Microdochium trichocladiopsis]KAH7020922.1 hypothetical protein B0I36DRAFT_26845 [Microdochium trichocladiopsis]
MRCQAQPQLAKRSCVQTIGCVHDSGGRPHLAPAPCTQRSTVLRNPGSRENCKMAPHLCSYSIHVPYSSLPARAAFLFGQHCSESSLLLSPMQYDTSAGSAAALTKFPQGSAFNNRVYPGTWCAFEHGGVDTSHDTRRIHGTHIHTCTDQKK